MKLKKFKPNNKQKKIIIGSIVAVFLLIGGIALYKTFALYEEKKEFNVLKGRIPNFVNIETIAIVNGSETTTIPKKEEKYGVSQIECDKNATAIWDNEKWQLEVKEITDKNITCTITFENAPILTLGNVTSDDISITIPYTVTGAEPLTTTCMAGLEEGNYLAEGVIESNKCKISNLQSGKTYYYKIEASNNTQTRAIETGNKATTLPTVSITGSSSTTSSITLSITTTGNITSKSCKCGSKSGSISGNSCTVSGLSGATTYSCSVTATNSSGYSVSASRSVTTQKPPATYRASTCRTDNGGDIDYSFYGSRTGKESLCQNACTNAGKTYYCAKATPADRSAGMYCYCS